MRREWDDCQGDEEGDDARKPRSTEVYVAPLSGSGGSREAVLLGSDRATWGARTATEAWRGPPGSPSAATKLRECYQASPARVTTHTVPPMASAGSRFARKLTLEAHSASTRWQDRGGREPPWRAASPSGVPACRLAEGVASVTSGSRRRARLRLNVLRGLPQNPPAEREECQSGESQDEKEQFAPGRVLGPVVDAVVAEVDEHVAKDGDQGKDYAMVAVK